MNNYSNQYQKNQYQKFIFKDWEFNKQQKKLTLSYSIDNLIDFQEIYEFPFEYANYSKSMLDRAINNLFFMAGVSYYKTYLPKEIVVEKGDLDEAHSKFFSETYQKGLGEFFYVNKLNPLTPIVFPITQKAPLEVQTFGQNDQSQGMMIGVGGGKDSLVSIELMRDNPNVSTVAMNHKSKLEPLINKINLPHYWINRQWDQKLIDLNKNGAFNGHVPFSAILACAGTVAAILAAKKDFVVSNERAANEPTLTYESVSINHQFSKSSYFEQAYQKILAADFGQNGRYYSLIRPFSELKVGKLFATYGFNKYREVFSSCNRAFVSENKAGLFWCGKCPKCAFTFLILTPFLNKNDLESLFGHNLLLDRTLEPLYKQLLGIDGDKPLECVGEIAETRAAMDLAKKIYPELQRYQYESDPDFEYENFGENDMPNEIEKLLKSRQEKLELTEPTTS